ncbi:MAG: hypothetical protein FWE18_01460 [Alphaproteobacteria bacterium]|nr:hypothetical protein [Alphaproteobacteria bacterium]
MIVSLKVILGVFLVFIVLSAAVSAKTYNSNTYNYSTAKYDKKSLKRLDPNKASFHPYDFNYNVGFFQAILQSMIK